MLVSASLACIEEHTAEHSWLTVFPFDAGAVPPGHVPGAVCQALPAATLPRPSALYSSYGLQGDQTTHRTGDASYMSIHLPVCGHNVHIIIIM